MFRIFRSLWGDFSKEEFKKIGILGIAMMLVIGNYWMLRITKDTLFDMLVGYQRWQPVAKMFSIFSMIFVVLGYSKLVDLFSRRKLIYIVSFFYGTIFILLSFFIANPALVTISQTSALYPFVSWIPGHALGWFIYLFLESYGSLLIGIFYAFIASVLTTDIAKKGYGMLASIIQLGTISGILISIFYVKSVASFAGFASIYFLGGIIIMLAPFVIKFYLKLFPKDVEEAKPSKQKKKTSFFEGIRLIVTKPYITGIFVVATFYEIMATIVEYQMNWVALNEVFPGDRAAFTVFRGIQAIGINSLALTFAFIGTSFLMRKFGLKFCLMAFPITIGSIMSLLFAIKFFGLAGHYYLMWILMFSTIAFKGLNYALNKPSSEVMYIPTSKDTKFKAKGWIDSFGNRSTKAIGSSVSKTFGYSLPALMLYGTIISLGIIGVWILVARFVGNTFEDLQKNKQAT